MLSRPNFRFSIFSLFLLITLAAVSVSHWLTSRKLREKESRDQNSSLELFSKLKCEHPDDAHVMGNTFFTTDFEQPVTDWGWRLHLPAAKRWRVCWIVGQIPLSSLPAKPIGFRDLPPITGDAQLGFDVTVPEDDSAPPTIDFHFGPYQSQPPLRWSQAVVGVERKLTWAFDLNAEVWWEQAGKQRDGDVSSSFGEQPVVLLRKGFRVPPLQSLDPDETPAEGILIWLEPVSAQTGK